MDETHFKKRRLYKDRIDVKRILYSKSSFFKTGSRSENKNSVGSKKGKNFEVFFKKRNDHEFIIFLKVGDQFTSWIHQDGIGEAKERFLMEGKTSYNFV